MRPLKITISVIMLLIILPSENAFAKQDRFFMEFAWKEMGPFKLMGKKMMFSKSYDTPDITDKKTVCICRTSYPPYIRIGIAFAFWDGQLIFETTKDPWFFPLWGANAGDYGGYKGEMSGSNHSMVEMGDEQTYAQTHVWIYPIYKMLGAFLDMSCRNDGTFTLVYLSEIDPTYPDDTISFFLHPESLLFANYFVQLACIADSVLVNLKMNVDALFWCQGSSPGSYPMNGRSDDAEMTQANQNIASRITYKLYRLGFLQEMALDLCQPVPAPIWFKTHHKLQPGRPKVKKKASPVGRTAIIWGVGQNPVTGTDKGSEGNYLWVVFRKKTCCLSMM